MIDIVELHDGQIVKMHGLFWLVEKSEVSLPNDPADYDPYPWLCRNRRNNATVEIRLKEVPCEVL